MQKVSNKIKIAIKCDLSKKSGLGHFKRMYGLSLELEKYNSKTYFIFFQNQKNIIKSLKNTSKFIFLKNSLKKQDNKIIEYLKNNHFDMLIIDSYENTEKLSNLLKQNSDIKLIKISDQLKNADHFKTQFFKLLNEHIMEKLHTTDPKLRDFFLRTFKDPAGNTIDKRYSHDQLHKLREEYTDIDALAIFGEEYKVNINFSKVLTHSVDEMLDQISINEDIENIG